MHPIATALTRALRSMFHPKILSMIIWPMLLAILFWGGIALFFWHGWVNSLTQLVSQTDIEAMILEYNLTWVASYLITFLIIILLIPIAYITALLITSLFAMPVMVNHVAKSHFPMLELKHGGTLVGSINNGIIAVLAYLILWIVTLPLWIFMPFTAIIPVLLTAYLNQRLFRYDALAEHASQEEFKEILARSGGKFYLLGGSLALLQFVPILQFFTPVYIGLAFIHFSLAELDTLRKTNVDDKPVSTGVISSL